METGATELATWASCGAMALTGPADGPPSPAPAAIASAMAAAAEDVAHQTGRWGRVVRVDGPALLGERAAITGMTRNGTVSVGGTARFVECRDGWIVLNLPRPEDVGALPALVGATVDPDDWAAIGARLRTMDAAEIVEQAALLGLAVATRHQGPSPFAPVRELHRGGRRTPSATPLVVDLSSLWAGPLATSLLAEAGARVIKVEGRTRPDGARRGAAAFFDLLNHGKECVSIDFGDRDDRRFLRGLLAAADLVVEGSRPRVMEELGVVPERLADAGTGWLSITGHGRVGPGAGRVGFGDDAAVAGGLLVEGRPPMFVADAVADPITGLVAAAFGAELLASDRAAVLDVPLARVAAWAGSDAVDAPVVADGDGWAVVVDGVPVAVAAPRHRPIPPVAGPTGCDDARIRAEFAPALG